MAEVTLRYFNPHLVLFDVSNLTFFVHSYSGGGGGGYYGGGGGFDASGGGGGNLHWGYQFCIFICLVILLFTLSALLLM